MMKTDDNHYKTSDLSLAATLSLYFPIALIDRTNGRKVLFVFNRTSALDELVTKYWQNKVVIEPQVFSNQLKNLKTRIYAGE